MCAECGGVCRFCGRPSLYLLFDPYVGPVLVCADHVRLAVHQSEARDMAPLN